ncbi:MAG: hypothetical protein JNK72_25365 [Myxococcales bacterium]|nr:hypothetical protein [Myxococcales bacterium]
MIDSVDSKNVRKALELARSQRTQITRGAPLPIDTAHVVGACPNCGVLGATILGFPDPPYAGPRGQPRYRNAKELARFIEELFKNPPPLPAPEDPTEGKGTPQQPPLWRGLCVCGAKVAPPQPDPRTGEMVGDPAATPRRVCGVRFVKAMPGAGAELMIESLAGGDGGIPFTDGVAIKHRILRAPLDGVESEVAAGLEDAAIEKAFSRPLTLATVWASVLDRAAAGEEVLLEVEPGYSIWAGPKEDKTLESQLKALIGDDPEMGAFPLAMLPQIAPMPQGPDFTLWTFEHAEKILKGDLRAGIMLDRKVVRKQIEAQLERISLGWQEQQGGALVLATANELRWPVEVAIVGLGGGHLGWYLNETTAAAAGEAMARIAEIKRFVDATKAERPECTFEFNGMNMLPKRADGSAGRPINLMDLPFRAPPGSNDFKREVRFSCDDLPKSADPTRRCPCGEKAWVSARLFPENVVSEFKKATGGKTPRIIEEWPKAALVATISCDRHVRIPLQEEIEGAGLKGATFDKRMAEDLPNSIFAVDVSMHEDKNKKRALLAYGPLMASVVINDHLVSALHQACGKPLRTSEASAVVTSPNILVLTEAGFDDERLDQVLDMGAGMDGIPADVDPPFDLSWDVSLTAAPVGKFMNLRPAPPEQMGGGGGGGAPGPRR